MSPLLLRQQFIEFIAFKFQRASPQGRHFFATTDLFSREPQTKNQMLRGGNKPAHGFRV